MHSMHSITVDTPRESTGTTKPTTASPDRTDTRIAVIGLGYVGLPVALLAQSQGYHVTGFDISEARVAAVRSKASSLSADERAALARTPLRTTTDARHIADACIYIVCVPTPVVDARPDLHPLESACRSIAAVLKKGDLVSIESTVNPGVCESLIPLLEKSGLRVERDWYMVHCPERINPGDTDWNVRTLPRVIGAPGETSLARGMDFYRSILDAPLMPMHTLKEAEAVKMVENSFRDINIAFVNELAMAFDRAGIDLQHVLEGASTKPFAFMRHNPGCGVGGHCIPVDPYYLIRFGEENGFKHTFLRTARVINDHMPNYTVSLLTQALRRRRKYLSGSTVALLGLTYKKDVRDERESPAHTIRTVLERRGVYVRSFDPFAPSTHTSLGAALQGSDAAIVATDHSQFQSLTPYHFMQHGVDVVIDGRNCLRKDDFRNSGIIYCGIGRGTV